MQEPDLRQSSRKRGYDYQWEQVRAIKLSVNPLCEECNHAGMTTPALMVHHIKPIYGKDDPGRLALDNLMSLCESCHDAKHSGAPESKRVQGCDVRGLPTHPDHPWAKAHE